MSISPQSNGCCVRLPMVLSYSDDEIRRHSVRHQLPPDRARHANAAAIVFIGDTTAMQRKRRPWPT